MLILIILLQDLTGDEVGFIQELFADIDNCPAGVDVDLSLFVRVLR